MVVCIVIVDVDCEDEKRKRSGVREKVSSLYAADALVGLSKADA